MTEPESVTESSPTATSTSDAGPSFRGWDRFALAAIVGGAVVRLVWALGFHRPFDHAYSDAAGYLDRAQRLAQGGPFERFDTFYPAGVHVLLALPLRIFGTDRAGLWAGAVLWSLMSCAIPVLVWRISRRLIGPRAAAVAGALTALWPLLIAYGGFFLSEIPSITVLLTSILCGLKAGESTGRRRFLYAGLAGFFGGVAIVMRPQLGLNVLIVAYVLLRKRERARPLAVAAAAGLLLPIAGIVSLNWAIADRPVVSENAGVQFLQAHCPVHIAYYGGEFETHGYYFMAAPPSVELKRGRDYVFPDGFPTEQGFQFREGMRCIRRDGIKHVGIVIRNIGDMGRTSVPWPPSNERGLRRFVKPANVLYSVVLPLIVVASVVRMKQKRRQGLAAGEGILLAHMVPLVILGALFVGDPRYRLPYDPFGLALAAGLIVWGIAMIRNRGAGAPGAPGEPDAAGVPAAMVED